MIEEVLLPCSFSHSFCLGVRGSCVFLRNFLIRLLASCLVIDMSGRSILSANSSLVSLIRWRGPGGGLRHIEGMCRIMVTNMPRHLLSRSWCAGSRPHIV